MPRSSASKTKPSSSRRGASVETQKTDEEEKLGFPRLIVRIWGMISAISNISSGGYLLAQSEEGKCKGAGAYMVFIGLVMLITECPCCVLLCRPDQNCCQKIESKVPFWARGLIYLLIMIPPIPLCFGLKTLLTSLAIIILALLYFFLTCLQRSRKYERFHGGINAIYKEKKNTATVSYQTLNHASATVNAFKSATNAAYQQKKQGGRQGRKAKTTTKV